MVSCGAIGAVITATMLVLAFQPSSPEMDVYKAMDFTADPCEDFYQYACGGWIANTELPPDRTSFLRSFSGATERNMEIVKDIILDETKHIYSKIGNFYKSCMDVGTANKLKAEPILPLMNEVGNLTTWDQVVVVAAALQRRGFDVLWDFGVGADAKNSQQNQFEMDQGGLTLPYRLYTANTTKSNMALAFYAEHVEWMFKLVGFNPVAAREEAIMAVRFERALAEAFINPQLITDPFARYNTMNQAQLTQLTGNKINWSAYFGELFKDSMGRPGAAPAIVNVVTPTYFTNLTAMFTKGDKDLSPIKASAYFRWRVITTSALWLSEDFLISHFRFFGTFLHGVKVLPPREKICVSRTHTVLTDLVVEIFLAKMDNAKTVEYATDLVQQLIKSFEGRLSQVDWMDLKTKQLAMAKLKAIRPMVAGPGSAELRNYSGIDISATDLFGNWFRSNSNGVMRDLEKLHHKPDPNKWHMAADAVNAYYDPDTNTIVFPIGILEPTFFVAGAAPAINYGGVGSVIGHEMTHGFDNKGRLFDAKGNLDDWWAPATSALFKQRTECVVDLFNRLGGDGKMSLGENIADMGGVKTAYEGFLTKEQSRQEVPPTQAPLTPNQLFFVAYAQNWCAVQTPQAAEMQKLTDVHSLPRNRVLGPLSNFDEFAKVYNCPRNSTYNPIKRCSVW
eukprot:CAMPEP_0114547566 /NCGR_PEP_ID=MMETSP0114-20121206/4529_1 /TAXON_ID=31324 /ORGANISM="Goniomonas sp, Strain m" /LENGTH=676 /DNA_ID=CAMNT_0001732123 /DNA_START=26 /DNA_END=2053 /DNA_ORIENTATION=+